MQTSPRIHLGRILFGREAIAFYLVGGLAAGAYVLATSYLIWIAPGWPEWVISGLTYALFMPLVYYAHRLFSFRSDAPHRRAFSRYLVVQGLGLLAATSLSYIIFHVLFLMPLLGAALVIALTSLFNFLVLRGWAFAVAEST